MPEYSINQLADMEIEPFPQFDTPYQLLTHLAPDQDWSGGETLTWKEAREIPGMMQLIVRVIQIQYHPTIRVRMKQK